MEVRICKDALSLGQSAARYSARVINRAVEAGREARIILSTGQSQFETLEALVREDVDWSRVTMFHLDEYVDLPEEHVASFRKYLKERFISKVPLKAFHLVEGKADQLPALSKLLGERPIDLGLIGIGENGHIAFNDPPCDFDTDEPYIIVDLNETCKKQQVGEGWFSSVDDVPRQAVSMSCRQILKCRTIVSAVPHKQKAVAVRNTLYSKVITNTVPATLLKTHPDFHLFLDVESASLLDDFDRITAFTGQVPVVITERSQKSAYIRRYLK